ncbi:hypothetical protein QE152_g39219 [Popillia japonica]|uniref:DNA-directed DNA polymerase n=1 Tax=Popillia japonica TaxID=7064 RepID=A0AAW1HV56_POPJA
MCQTQPIRKAGYEVIEKWEYDFRNEMTDQVKPYPENHELLCNTPFKPRDAFYGGRTGASKMYYTTAEGEKIKNVDICSLHPWVNKYVKDPVGYSKVYVGVKKLKTSISARYIHGLINM